ncbi:unnamed protein product [Cylicocyclus nassatus]|uniref:Amino acid transporter transmembrane domain-containing protein n=1 Tax=Cylicocyclus nassatus TaxID=53992 RepID=A0AA36GRW2_CYLNA|nr:unnamed protein product [Cylicocyclus nassatus]
MSISSMSTMNGNAEAFAAAEREPTIQELFAPRIRERESISPDQALIHMFKVMMGTGMLSLPLAFTHSGLWTLATLAVIGNVIYLTAVCIVPQQLFQIECPSRSLLAVANWSVLQLFFGTVMFAFEGVQW